MGVFFPFFVLESSECFWVKTGAMVHFLGPLGGLVWSSGTSAVLRIKIEKIAFVRIWPSPLFYAFSLVCVLWVAEKIKTKILKYPKKIRGITYFNLPESIKKTFFDF